jgi:hypothetical protein
LSPPTRNLSANLVSNASHPGLATPSGVTGRFSRRLNASNFRLIERLELALSRSLHRMTVRSPVLSHPPCDYIIDALRLLASKLRNLSMLAFKVGGFIRRAVQKSGRSRHVGMHRLYIIFCRRVLAATGHEVRKTRRPCACRFAQSERAKNAANPESVSIRTAQLAAPKRIRGYSQHAPPRSALGKRWGEGLSTDDRGGPESHHAELGMKI